MEKKKLRYDCEKTYIQERRLLHHQHQWRAWYLQNPMMDVRHWHLFLFN